MLHNGDNEDEWSRSIIRRDTKVDINEERAENGREKTYKRGRKQKGGTRKGKEKKIRKEGRCEKQYRVRVKRKEKEKSRIWEEGREEKQGKERAKRK